jgi:quercetin dioxygenase-like cupin family protein
MDDSAIFKIWGERRRILLTDKCEIDLLYLKQHTFCSTHCHKNKINRFYVVSGQVRIETEFGTIILCANDVWEVRPPQKHRFYAEEDSIMIEMAYVERGKINPNDIQRDTQGGKKIEDIEYTEDELKEKGMLEL